MRTLVRTGRVSAPTDHQTTFLTV